MPSITLYQCVPSYLPRATVRLIKSLANTECKILLDIEDSIQDIENPHLTPQLKIKAREDLLQIARSLSPQKFSIRINSLSGKELEKDKKLLYSIRTNIESVFIPKVESKDELIAFYDEFKNDFKINLIIETQKGIDNIEGIINTAFADKIEFIFFGNYDFHLDTNTYPIIEQNNSRYWEIVLPIISKAEKNNICFGNSPYTNIADLNCLNFSLAKLLELCKKDFGLMSLHKTQTIHYRMLISKLAGGKPYSEEQHLFSHTIDEFKKNRLKGRSFAFASNKKIITPQEYLLLKRKQNG